MGLLYLLIWATKKRCAAVKRLTSQVQHSRLRHEGENLLSLSGKKRAGEWTKKADNSREGGVTRRKRTRQERDREEGIPST